MYDGKTTMNEAASPIKNYDFPASHVIVYWRICGSYTNKNSGIYLRSTPHPVTVTNEGL